MGDRSSKPPGAASTRGQISATAEPAKKRSRPISRVLSGTIIHLGRPSPDASCDLPGDACGPQDARGMSPYLVLLQRGFAMPLSLPTVRCALTAPFHPYRDSSPWRSTFCCTFRRLAPPRHYLASCPVEPGLSSATNLVTAIVWPTPLRTVSQSTQRDNRHQPACSSSARR